ncbi:MAG TPA: universal stress protein [Thermoanaerobaculia bacterium]|nr:universal stress protein [Thermoanaerobaculia bacterium]
MYPFRRILIPTDFSTASEWVFDDAVRIAGTDHAEILILHIRMTSKAHPDELRFPADPSLYEYAEKQELELLRDRVRRANAHVATRLVVKKGPEAGTEICRTAVEEDADLIVIATHARHHVAHLLIGSTTVSVIADPPAPVLSIRYGVRKRTTLRRIVVPVHLKQTSRAAFDLATAIATREGGEVHAVTVCSPAARGEAEAHIAALASSAAGVRTHIITGNDIEREIVRFAQSSDADVIFLNSQGPVGDAKAAMIRHASTPVMVVPK